MDVVSDIRTLLTGITTIYLEEMPDTPDTCIAIFSDSGRDPSYNFGNGNEVMRRPSIQIMARAASRVTVAANLESVRTALSGKVVTISGISYCIMQKGDIIRISRDDNNRVRHVLNFDINAIS